MTALPNLHPALVHFPVALLPVAILFDLLGLRLGKEEWLSKGATLLWVVAALGTILAYWAGRRAADGLVDVPPRTQFFIGQHSDWATYAVWTVAAVAVLRLGAEFWMRSIRGRAGGAAGAPQTKLSTILRAILLVPAILGLSLVFKTADLGGGLVFQHALGVRIPTFPASTLKTTATGSTVDPDSTHSPRNLGPAQSRLVEGRDGVLRWNPLPKDAEALGSVLTFASGFETAVEPFEVRNASGPGLGLKVSGRSLLLLPGVFANVQVEARVELLDFVGTFGLAHHVKGVDELGRFTLSTPGDALLESIHRNGTSLLDGNSVKLPHGPLLLAVNVAGTHLKGMLDGTTITHGHTEQGPAGSVGLVFDGEGLVRIVSMTITPL